MSFFNAPFTHIESSAPGFSSTADSSGVYALESTGLREWQFPQNRAIRVASLGTDDAYIKFGTSDVTPSGSSAGMLILGNTVEVFRNLSPKFTHVAIKSSTADFVLNVTLGTGYP